ncbi:MAG: right-handed parallel beta-helix repeat-containing protein [Candidatus Thorarchaeota archaeon]
MSSIKLSQQQLLSVLLLIGLFLAYNTGTALPRYVAYAELNRLPVLSDLGTHIPIVITDDANFSTLGFLGSGIEGDPYIIENLSIISDEICVNISDTTSHFVIRNVYLAGNTTANNQGIWFSNVVNGTIEDSTITWRSNGVSILSSTDIVINNVEISNTSLHGITLSGSYINVTNSYIHDLAGSAHGIYDSSNYPYFYNCTIIGASYGFNLIGSTPVVDSCTIIDNDVYGVYMNTVTPTILNSSIRRNGGTGIYSYLGGNRQIHNNTISHNGGRGIHLRIGLGSDVTGNTIYKNSIQGIYIDSSGIAQNNHFYSNRIGWQSPNAQDASGRLNYFDDEVSLGNAWSDYGGTGTYTPTGSLDADHYPTELNDTQSLVGTPATNITFGQGTTGNMISWSVYDEWPNTYTLYINGSQSVTKWLGGPIEISFDYLTEGYYNVTIVVSDCGGATITDTVWADVYLFDLEQLVDISFESGTNNHWLNWTTRCAFPTNYEVQVDGQLDVSGIWDGENLNFNVDHIPLGIHTVTIILTNSTDDQLLDNVEVTVYDTIEPTVDDLGYYVFELGFPRTISWSAADQNPSSFIITRNGSILFEGTWIGGEIQILVQNMETGLFNYTLSITDEATNTAVDTVLVLVIDSIAPTISHPEDVITEVGEPDVSIIWSIHDYSNGTYVIFVDDEEYASGYFESGDIEMSTTSVSSGFHNVTLLIIDESGNSDSDTVWLNVTENLAPTVIGPVYVEMTEEQLGVWVQWNCSDSNPDRYSIRVNSTLVESGIWEGYDISFSLINIPAGQHNITLTLWDVQGLSSSFTVIVIVHSIVTTPTTTPVTSTTTSDVLEELEFLRIALILVGAFAAFSVIVSIALVFVSRRNS